MSKELLRFLNGKNKGYFYEYLENLDHDPSIAWYPSAGTDLRALLYLSPQYATEYPANFENESFPDIFLFTDYMPSLTESFLSSEIIIKDMNTEIRRLEIEELPRLELPIDNEIVNPSENNVYIGKVLFLKVHVSSNVLGEMEYPIVYAFVENEPFCSEVLLPRNSKISHIVHIQYSRSPFDSRGKSSGIWVLNVLKRLSCEVFITDKGYKVRPVDEVAYRLYPNEAAYGLYPKLRGSPPLMNSIRQIDDWAIRSVSWNLIE
jgi:hypothetical protein